jgi:hypothetical protein
VFRVSASPELHSRGFHITFDLERHAELGYILPTWVDVGAQQHARAQEEGTLDDRSANGGAGSAVACDAAARRASLPAVGTVLGYGLSRRRTSSPSGGRHMAPRPGTGSATAVKFRAAGDGGIGRISFTREQPGGALERCRPACAVEAATTCIVLPLRQHLHCPAAAGAIAPSPPVGGALASSPGGTDLWLRPAGEGPGLWGGAGDPSSGGPAAIAALHHKFADIQPQLLLFLQRLSRLVVTQLCQGPAGGGLQPPRAALAAELTVRGGGMPPVIPADVARSVVPHGERGRLLVSKIMSRVQLPHSHIVALCVEERTVAQGPMAGESLPWRPRDLAHANAAGGPGGMETDETGEPAAVGLTRQEDHGAGRGPLMPGADWHVKKQEGQHRPQALDSHQDPKWLAEHAAEQPATRQYWLVHRCRAMRLSGC